MNGEEIKTDSAQLRKKNYMIVILVKFFISLFCNFFSIILSCVLILSARSDRDGDIMEGIGRRGEERGKEGDGRGRPTHD